MVNSYERFSDLISDVKKTKNPTSGCYYYIEDMEDKNRNNRDIYHGKFLHRKTMKYFDNYGEEKTKTVDYFDDLKYFINPFKKEALPHGFIKNKNRYFIDNKTPCDSDIQNKKDVISDLEETITHYKYKPREENDPNLDWIGEEFEKAKESFEKKTRTKKGGKNNRRKTQKRKTTKNRK
jgi:hypothetical protein